MKSYPLHIAIREATTRFGKEVVLNDKFINILLDFDAFKELPATKNILKEMFAEGYCLKVCELGKKKRSFFSFSSSNTFEKPEGDSWKIKVASFEESLYKQKGFQRDYINYVFDSLLYGLQWVDSEPTIPNTANISSNQQSNTQNTVKPVPKPNHKSNTSGTNTNKTNSITYNNIVDSQFVVMKVHPLNAEVFIDGQQQYVSNGVMAVELSVGKHTYEVKADSYETKAGDFDINSNDKTELDVKLELEAQKVQLHVKSADFDAEIIINGTSFGNGEWNGLVETGTYEIEAKRPRFYSYKETITLINQKDATVKLPSLKPICGNLKINIQPYGSEIYINGERKGNTPLLVSGIQIGERSLRVVSGEGVEYTTVVDVRENQVTDVNHIIPSLFYDDYSKVKIGDYFYEDGTLSHELAKGKKVVGMVFSLETSDEEKRHGWTHGQIVALKDAKVADTKVSSWGVPNKTILKYALSNPGGILKDKDKGYEVCHLDCVINNSEFTPFLMAAQYPVKLPNNLTSGWYLPSVVQWRNLWSNTHSDWNRIWHYLKITGTRGCSDYATSSIKDSKTAWLYRMGMAEEYISTAYQPTDIKEGWTNVRAVAAF